MIKFLPLNTREDGHVNGQQRWECFDQDKKIKKTETFMLISPLRLTNFRLLWLGQTLTLCATQFWFFSLTWLVLQKTNSGLAVGTVLMAAAIPRGLFMLVGGAISDQISKKTVATTAACVSTVLTGFIVALSVFDTIELRYLIIIAILFGLSEAFLYPAILALLPQLISKSKLGEANAWMQGSEQITDIIGPASAGFVIGASNLTFAFVVNTLTFLFGCISIYLLKTRHNSVSSKVTTNSNFTDKILVSLRHAWTDSAIRISLLLLAMINFTMLGPMVIGLAALVNTRFGANAMTFGYLQSSYGIGALVGVCLASQLNKIKSPKTYLISLSYGLGIGLIVLGFVGNVWIASGIIILMGIGCGIVSVLGITWLQQNTEAQMQGRIMGLVMFATVALDPFSQAIFGALLEVSLTTLFIVAGIIMLTTAIISSGIFSFKTLRILK